MRRFDHYLDSPEGLLAQYRKRAKARFWFDINGIEPRSKKSMQDSDKLDVQKQLQQSLINQRRRSFRGPLALRLNVQTTVSEPTHSHHIAKNLLDLFSTPLPDLNTRRKSLLYVDDRQIHALSVTCQHGETEPGIWGMARPLRDLLHDLEIANEVNEEQKSRYLLRDEVNFENALDYYTSLLENATKYESLIGKQPYKAWLRNAQQRAQEAMFAKHQLQPRDLYHLYGLGMSRKFPSDTADIWEQVFSMSPLRIKLSELPHVNGASEKWKDEIDEKLREFQENYKWLIDPLLTPLAMEVVIRPPSPSRSNALHDLDNVLRNYLIPSVVKILKPISHHSFSIDFDALGGIVQNTPHSSEFEAWVRSRKTPPKSTRTGVTRYEAWRLPPAVDGSKGFVSIALVSDSIGSGDVISRIDKDVEDWKDSLE